jgi:hypothetical protein
MMVPTKFSIDSACVSFNEVVSTREDTEMKNRICIAVSFLLLSFATISAAGAEPRQSFTSQGKDVVRGSVVDGTYNEHAPLTLKNTDGTVNKDDSTKQHAAIAGVGGDPSFWFYDVDVALFSDVDRDGYYFGIDLEFDADTYYAEADVYAVLYLSYEYGPWNEYATTETITLFGSTDIDDYTIETELVSGYPTGSYDILIELYDAWDGTFLASIGPEDSSELSLLPLEDATRDSAGETQVVINSGGGSLGWLLLLGLFAVRMTLRPHAARLSK